MQPEKETLHAKEADFHDDWAASIPVGDVRVRECFEAPTAFENRFLLQRMGNLKGKRILDVGAGLGESSVYFALQGADVTMTDLSPGMVEMGTRLAAHHGTSIKTVVCPAEALAVPDNSFDIVYIANTLHHVPDKKQVFSEIRRALKPGGTYYSIDPLIYNPVINAYRRMATEVRTPDECPLSFNDLTLIRTYFTNVGHREFWIGSLLLFLKYYMFDRVHPNSDRYWKRILKETPGSIWWLYPSILSDKLLTRLPLIKRLAWNIVIWGQKPQP